MQQCPHHGLFPTDDNATMDLFMTAICMAWAVLQQVNAFDRGYSGEHSVPDSRAVNITNVCDGYTNNCLDFHLLL